jgi:carboxymethylenebutenolidase
MRRTPPPCDNQSMLPSHTTLIRSLAVAATLVATLPPASAFADTAPGPITWSTAAYPPCTANGGQAAYTNGQAALTGLLAKPDGDGPFPGVLVLHPQGGLHDWHEGAFVQFLASQGYAALAPDYFTPEGITPATFEQSWSTKADAVREDLARGLDCLKSLPWVAPAQLGVVGFSLGGHWAMLLSTRSDVKAVVTWYGAMEGRPLNGANVKYPFGVVAGAVSAPVLMLQGDADRDIFVASARGARDLLVSLGKPAELVMYPGADHGWDQQGNPSYVYSEAATQDARARTLAFLGARLK